MTRVHLAEESSFRKKKGRRRCRKVLPATSDPPWSKILKQVTKLSRNDFISYVIKFTKLFQSYRYFLPKKNDRSFENPQMKWTWDPNILNDCPETTSQFVPLSQAWFDRNSYCIHIHVQKCAPYITKLHWSYSLLLNSSCCKISPKFCFLSS